MTGTKKTRDVGMKAHEVTSYDLRSPDPAEHEANLAAWKRFAEAQPKEEPGDGPFDALRRRRAERCKAIITSEGLGDLLELRLAPELGRAFRPRVRALFAHGAGTAPVPAEPPKE